MKLCIIYQSASGGISICHPSDGARLDGESDEALAVRIAHKDIPHGTPFRVIATAELSADRSERDLWSADFTNHDGIAGQP